MDLCHHSNSSWNWYCTFLSRHVQLHHSGHQYRAQKLFCQLSICHCTSQFLWGGHFICKYWCSVCKCQQWFLGASQLHLHLCQTIQMMKSTYWACQAADFSYQTSHPFSFSIQKCCVVVYVVYTVQCQVLFHFFNSSNNVVVLQQAGTYSLE